MMPLTQTIYVNDVIIKQLIWKVAGKVGRDQKCGTIAAYAYSRAPRFQTRRLEYECDADLSKQLTSAFNHHASFLTHWLSETLRPTVIGVDNPACLERWDFPWDKCIGNQLKETRHVIKPDY
jgi:hypothetical protein